MQNLIEYLMEVLNIKSDNEFVIKDIATELQKVNDIADYRKYVRDNIKNIDLEYLTGFQKFIELTNKYLKQQDDIILGAKFEQGEKYAKELASKVKICRNFVEDAGCEFSQVSAEGEKLFKEHELKALSKVGSVIAIIEFSKTNRLAGEIYKEYVSAIRSKHNAPQITSGQKRVSELIGKVL